MSKQAHTPSTEALDAYFASFAPIDVRVPASVPLPTPSRAVSRTRSSVQLCLESLEDREMFSATVFGTPENNYDSALVWSPPSSGSYQTVTAQLEAHASGLVANNASVNFGEGVQVQVSTGTGGASVVRDAALLALNDAYDVLHGTEQNPLGTDHMTFDFPQLLTGASAILLKHVNPATPAQGNVLIDTPNGRTTVPIPANGIIPWNPALGIQRIILINVHAQGDLRPVGLDGIEVQMYFADTPSDTGELTNRVAALTLQTADAQTALTNAQNTTPSPPAVTNLPWPEGSNASQSILGKLNVHPGQNLYNARFSPDGAFFVTASQDRTAKIWNASTGALVRTLSGNNSLVIDAVWSNDGQSMWTSGYDKHVRQYNVSDGSLLWDSGELPSLCLNAAMSQDGATLLVDMHGVSPITINTSTKQINALGDGFDWAEQVAAVSDGTMLVGDGGGPTIINPATRAVILRLTGLGNAASAVAASPNAQWIFAGGDGGALAVWNRSTGQKTQLPNQSGYVSSLTISGDGNHLFVASGNQVNAYDLRPLGSNQVPTLLTTYTGIGTGPRSLAVQGKTVTAVSGDGAASRMVALDRSGLPGYTVPNPAVDSAQANLTVLQGQLSQATSQLALLQAEETERDDIMELLAHANTQAQYVEADTLETTQQDRRIDALLDVQTLGGSVRLSSWQGVRSSLPALERNQDGSLNFTGSAATLDLTSAAHRVTSVSFVATTSTGNQATVRFLRGDDILATKTVQSGATVSHSDNEGITGVVVLNEEQALSQQAQEFLNYFNSRDGQYQASRYAWEWWNQNGFKSFPQFGGASLAYFAQPAHSSIPDAEKWDILREAANGRRYATLTLDTIAIAGNNAQSQPTVPHTLETTPTGLLVNAPDWRQNDDTLRRGPSPGYLAVGRFDPYKVGVVRNQSQYSAITLSTLQGSATPQKVHYHTSGGDTELSQDYYRIVGKTVILYPGAPSQVVIYLTSGSTQDPGTVDIGHIQSANAADILPPEAMTIRTDILAIRNLGPGEGVSDGLTSVPDTGRAITPSSGNVLLNVWNAGQTGGTVRVITNEGTPNAREVSFTLAGQAAKSVSLNFATPENGVLSVTVVLPDGRRVVDGRTLKLQGESSEKRVATQQPDGTWLLEWKPSSYAGPTVVSNGQADTQFSQWRQQRLLSTGDTRYGDPSLYQQLLFTYLHDTGRDVPPDGFGGSEPNPETTTSALKAVVANIGRSDPTAVFQEIYGLYNPPLGQTYPKINDVYVDTSTAAGKIFMGMFQNIWAGDSAHSMTIVAKVARVIGIDPTQLYNMTRSHDAERLFGGMRLLFTQAGFGKIFSAFSTNFIERGTDMLVSTDKQAYTSGTVRIMFSPPVLPNQTPKHARISIADANKTLILDPQWTPNAFGKLFYDLPLSQLGQSFSGQVRIKVAVWDTGNNVIGGGYSDLITLQWDGQPESGDFSTLPQGAEHQRQNVVLTEVANNFPVANPQGRYWNLGSGYHDGHEYHAVDVNSNEGGDSDRGDVVKAMAEGILRIGAYTADVQKDLNTGAITIDHVTTRNGITVHWQSGYLHMPIFATGRKEIVEVMVNGSIELQERDIYEIRHQETENGIVVDTTEKIFVWDGKFVRAKESIGFTGGRESRNEDGSYSEGLDNAHNHIFAKIDNEAIDLRKAVFAAGLTTVKAFDAGPDENWATIADNASRVVTWNDALGWVNTAEHLVLDRRDQLPLTPGVQTQQHWLAWEEGKTIEQMGKIVWVEKLPDGTIINGWLKADNFLKKWNPLTQLFEDR